MTLHTLVKIYICFTWVDFGMCRLSIIQDIVACVHRSAIKRLHCRIVLCDVAILDILTQLKLRCSWQYNYNILQVIDTIQRGLETLCTYIISLCLQICINFAQKLIMLLKAYSENVYEGVHYCQYRSFYSKIHVFSMVVIAILSCKLSPMDSQYAFLNRYQQHIMQYV
jgi:hypothetical protein